MRQQRGRAPKQARRQRPQQGRRLARNTAEAELVIDRVGSRGDGIGTAPYLLDYETAHRTFFVPGTLAGERVRVRPTAVTARGITAEIVELIRPSPDRAEPVCDVFAGGQGCGGCAFQHMAEAAYRRTKAETFIKLLEKAGQDTEIRPPVWTQMAGRRRARLSFRRTAAGLVTGFAGRNSHFIHPLDSCGVLSPALKQSVGRIKSWAEPHFAPGLSGWIAVNMLDQGADILVQADRMPDRGQLAGLSAGAAELAVVRLAIQTDRSEQPVILLERARPTLRQHEAAGGQTLMPPPGGFLQASAEAETALIQAVLEAADKRQAALQETGRRLQVADLYCGAGTFSLPLLAKGVQLTGYEADRAAADALLAAARAAGSGSRCTAEVRDLAAAPVRADELGRADLILVDPPRSGAPAQMREIAALGRRRADGGPDLIPDVIMVSCNPHTALRDMAVLTAAGWQTCWVQMVDQFVRTPHTEMVARLCHTGPPQ